VRILKIEYGTHLYTWRCATSHFQLKLKVVVSSSGADIMHFSDERISCINLGILCRFINGIEFLYEKLAISGCCSLL
jgi:hypothetical protein